MPKLKDHYQNHRFGLRHLNSLFYEKVIFLILVSPLSKTVLSGTRRILNLFLNIFRDFKSSFRLNFKDYLF